MRISDWSSDVCSSDLAAEVAAIGKSAEGTGSGAARRTGRETAHWRCADADMADACVGDPNLTARAAKQLHQCIARRDRSRAGTGMAATARTIPFARGDARARDAWTHGPPARAIATPRERRRGRKA